MTYILEVKAEKAGVVVFHKFSVVSSEECLPKSTQSMIETAIGTKLEQDDFASIQDLIFHGETFGRFGADWEYDVQALIMTAEDCDIDEEFDSIHDKYRLCL